MEETNILVIGDGAEATVAAITAKSFHRHKNVLLIRSNKEAVIPSKIPSLLNPLRTIEMSSNSDTLLAEAGVRIRTDEVVSIDQKNRICQTANGTEIGFDKLILGLGSMPIVPNWINGTKLENVFALPKNEDQLDAISKELAQCRKVVIVGGGIIGVEVSVELNKAGKDVTLIEILPHVLELAFDEEFAIRAEEILESRGIRTRMLNQVKEIEGETRVTGVRLDSGERIEADAVIFALGYHPYTVLARNSGIEVNDKGFIRVDEYMRTSNLNIFAIGDCAEKKSFITHISRNIMLASTACAEARIAALNLYNLSVVKTFTGTIAISATVIGNTAFGVAGITESMAKEMGFNIAVGTYEGFDKFSAEIPDAHKQTVKLIVARESGVLIGGQVMGGTSTGELINLIGFAVENRMTVNSILTGQIGTHPLLTAAPTVYPLIKAAEVIAKKRWVQWQP